MSSSRDHKEAKLRVADAATGDVREVIEEGVATQYESGQGAANWQYLPATKEVDLVLGTRRLGPSLPVRSDDRQGQESDHKRELCRYAMVKMDDKARVLYFEANGREPGRDPYFTHFYRINFDGTGFALLTPEDGNHQVALRRTEVFCRQLLEAGRSARAVLRDMTGKLVADLEKADVRASRPPAGNRRHRSP